MFLVQNSLEHTFSFFFLAEQTLNSEDFLTYSDKDSLLWLYCAIQINFKDHFTQTVPSFSSVTSSCQTNQSDPRGFHGFLKGLKQVIDQDNELFNMDI